MESCGKCVEPVVVEKGKGAMTKDRFDETLQQQGPTTCSYCGAAYGHMMYCAAPNVIPPLRAHDYQTSGGTNTTQSPSVEVTGPITPHRVFSSGATRDTAEGKLEIAGFLHPLVVERYSAYMHKNRLMKDGSMRASNNWTSGFPEEVLMQSAFRHFLDFWKEHNGIETEAGMEEAICATLFNLQAYLLQALKKREYTGETK